MGYNQEDVMVFKPTPGSINERTSENQTVTGQRHEYEYITSSNIKLPQVTDHETGYAQIELHQTMNNAKDSHKATDEVKYDNNISHKDKQDDTVLIDNDLYQSDAESSAVGTVLIDNDLYQGVDSGKNDVVLIDNDIYQGGEDNTVLADNERMMVDNDVYECSEL